VELHLEVVISFEDEDEGFADEGFADEGGMK
jgi:hypothetical protein